MISILRGTVASVGLDHIDILVGGIGFRVHVTPAFAQGASRDAEMTVFTSMIVRGLRIDGRSEQRGGTGHDGLKLVGLVELKVGRKAKAVTQRGW